MALLHSGGYAGISYATNTNRWEHYSHFLESTALWLLGKHSLTFGYDGRLILEHQQSAGNGVGALTRHGSDEWPKRHQLSSL